MLPSDLPTRGNPIAQKVVILWGGFGTVNGFVLTTWALKSAEVEEEKVNVQIMAGLALMGSGLPPAQHLRLSLKEGTACGHRMAHRKWKEIKQQPSMLPGQTVPGCCLVSFHFLWAIHPVHV